MPTYCAPPVELPEAFVSRRVAAWRRLLWARTPREWVAAWAALHGHPVDAAAVVRMVDGVARQKRWLCCEAWDYFYEVARETMPHYRQDKGATLLSLLRRNLLR